MGFGLPGGPRRAFDRQTLAEYAQEWFTPPRLTAVGLSVFGFLPGRSDRREPVWAFPFQAVCFADVFVCSFVIAGNRENDKRRN